MKLEKNVKEQFDQSISYKKKEKAKKKTKKQKAELQKNISINLKRKKEEIRQETVRPVDSL